jgi:diaminohydroxyphosphoribosylaminopyrimidine deaminase/5-amino-6-(5-phosphoribosylamino)uracil reductase|tara:strand:- start:1849 stop:2415 length:567 start_codon:yes stop_codon:yes gene_type:complete
MVLLLPSVWMMATKKTRFEGTFHGGLAGKCFMARFRMSEMSEQAKYERFMREAILEALKGDVSKTSPNPLVGSVIVESGVVVARGFFESDGGPHAERKALADLGRTPLPGAALYVTLEPCSTHGRTGACSEAIVKAGILEVVVGTLDPTPAHRGAGLHTLREAGVSVVADVLVAECEAINPGFAGRET